jgi:hypothetical protein
MRFARRMGWIFDSSNDIDTKDKSGSKEWRLQDLKSRRAIVEWRITQVLALRLRCGENSMPSPLLATQGGCSQQVKSSLCLKRAIRDEADLSSCM